MKATITLGLLLTVTSCCRLQAQISPANKETRTNAQPPDLTAERVGHIQYPLPYRQKAFRMRDNGRALEMQLSGDKWPGTDRDTLVTPFQMLTFRNGPSNELQLIAESPHCHIDSVAHRGWDSGPIVLFTPTTNVWVQGDGFLFIETNHFLYVSNQVETHVVRSLLKSSMLSGSKTNTPGEQGSILKILADGPAVFDNQANLVRYFNRVHVIDVQLDMTSDRLSIQFTTNGAIQTILAEDNVVMTTTNKGWATGPRAFYYITNGNEMMEMTGGAVWHNGDEQARAKKFLYNSTTHFLTAIDDVNVWWPVAPQKPGFEPKADTNGFRKLWSDFATLQMPPTNGPIEAMHATGNVLIVNQADHSSSTSDQADYVRTDNLFQLTGTPKWWNETMEIKGRTLSADATNQVYHAHGDAKLKLRVSSTSRSNQVVYVDSEDLDYATNVAIFRNHVNARLFEGEVLRDTLHSDRLDVELISNEVKTAVATGHVQGETAPDKLGRTKTITCEKLTAHHSPVTKLMEQVFAEGQVVLRQFGTNAAEPRDQLTADIVKAYFSPVTNQVVRVVANTDVVIDQVKTNQFIHATGRYADYRVPADEVKLTGTPVATTDRYFVTNADYFIWQPKTNRFRAYGSYDILPVKSKATNAPS